MSQIACYQDLRGSPIILAMEITDISRITALFAVLAMAGIFLFFKRSPIQWSRLAVCVVSAIGIVVGCLLLALLVLRGTPEEHVFELPNGTLKVLVRTQEFRHSGTVNVDICAARASSKSFPKDRMQCFFHGYDFSGLSVAWHSDRNIEVSFRSGYLTHFQNYAIVKEGSETDSFHTSVIDREGNTSNATESSPRLNVNF